jgi:hypothetical protein
MKAFTRMGDVFFTVVLVIGVYSIATELLGLAGNEDPPRRLEGNCHHIAAHMHAVRMGENARLDPKEFLPSAKFDRNKPLPTIEEGSRENSSDATSQDVAE